MKEKEDVMPETVKSILMIDDDAEFCSIILEYLEKRNFRVECAYSGESGLEMLLGQPDFDLVLLDMMLPDMNGQEVLRSIRGASRAPVIMLSALNEEIDRILTLELGADDYVPKVFSSRELLARIRTVLRRNERSVQQSGSDDVIRIRNVELNKITRDVFLDGEKIVLTMGEFTLLKAMMEEPGRVFSREELVGLLSGREFSPFDRSVDMHISFLRHKLKDDPRKPSHILTLRSCGYSFIR